jgi:1,4-dihydroxy-2-naphthoate octaprenyltransferase
MKNTLKSILLLIHYWFPVALGWSIALVIHRATGLPILPSGNYLYLLTIWAAYSLDRLLDRPKVVRPLWLNVSLWVGFVVAAILGAVLAFQLSFKTISVIVLFSITTILYTKVKKIPFLKTILVAIVWVWAGIALPFQNQHWFAWQFWTMQASLPLVMLIAAGVILCDFKDLKSDGEDGVRTFPVVLGLRNTILGTSILLFIAALISYEQGRIGLMISSIALIGLAQFPAILSLDTIPGVMIFLHLV